MPCTARSTRASSGVAGVAGLGGISRSGVGAGATRRGAAVELAW